MQCSFATGSAPFGQLLQYLCKRKHWSINSHDRAEVFLTAIFFLIPPWRVYNAARSRLWRKGGLDQLGYFEGFLNCDLEPIRHLRVREGPSALGELPIFIGQLGICTAN